ncbi:MAG: hypothetical protein LBK00_11065 [Treponema sp.]|nr:hypothetical protein [Treponema sp.]
MMLANVDVCYRTNGGRRETQADTVYEVTNDGNDKNRLVPVVESAREVREVEGVSVVADTGYDSAQNIGAGMEAGMDIHVAGEDYDIYVPAEDGRSHHGA